VAAGQQSARVDPEDGLASVNGLMADVEALGGPLVVLVGGGTGVGKSTVATQLAYSLGITRVSSTDFIRHVLRTVVPEAIAPELSRSSFELDRGRRPGRHAEFERQAQQVMVGVRATVERAVEEGMPLIVEGIHLLPDLVDSDLARDGLLVFAVLSVEDQRDHLNRFAARARTSKRPAGRYEKNLERIRDLQDHVIDAARRCGTPVVQNRRVDATVQGILGLVADAVDGFSPPRRLKSVQR